MARTDTCGTCRFFQMATDRFSADPAGHCHRMPPLSAGRGLISAFPITTASMWCGEHRPAPLRTGDDRVTLDLRFEPLDAAPPVGQAGFEPARFMVVPSMGEITIEFGARSGAHIEAAPTEERGFETELHDRTVWRAMDLSSRLAEVALGTGTVTLDNRDDRESREDRMVEIERDPVTGEPTVWCDPEIADIVRALNAGGVKTVASCSGHGVQPAIIALADGREIIIARDWEQARAFERMFPRLDGMVSGPFQVGSFVSASGMTLWGKFDADLIPDSWWRGIAHWIDNRARGFNEVIGVPTGGDRLAAALKPFCRPGKGFGRLIVDDVLTTGDSIRRLMTEPGDRGFVLLARGPLPPNVEALLTLDAGKSDVR